MALDPKSVPNQFEIKGSGKPFVLMRASYSQKINGGYVIEVEAVSDDPEVKIEDLIGKSAVVHVAKDDGQGGFTASVVVLHGVVLEGRWTGESTDFYSSEETYVYEFMLGPFLELARLRTDSRVFTSLSPVDIIRTVAQEHAGDYGTVKIPDDAGAEPTFEHFMQYRESDHDFIRRIAERYGINMLHEMSEGGNDLVLYDKNASVGGAVKEVDASDGADRLFHHFRRRMSFRTAAVEMADYDQFKPNSNQIEHAEDVPGYGAAKWEEFDYPAGYPDGIKRAKIVKRRLDALKTESEGITAMCSSIEVKVGERYKLSGHHSDIFNGTFVVTAFGLTVSNTGKDHGGGHGAGARVTLMPDEIDIAPSRTLAAPQIPGIVTAKVVDGSENDPKKMGRVKVRYPFVRKDTSFWCRVSQTWAGPGLGTWVNHRIDHEVVIAFEHGDINRPIVIGSIFNGVNGNPWIDDLGDEVSGWRTQSPAGFNELLFRDKGDDELLSMIAQKNMTVTVKNDQTETVQNDQTESITRHYSKSVGGNSEWTTQGTTYVKSIGSMTLESPTKITLICGGSTITMTPTAIEMNSTTIMANALKEVLVNAGVLISEAASEVVMTAGKSLMASAGDEIGIATKKLSSSGSDEVLIDAGKKYALTAGENAEFQTGKDFKVKGKKAVQIKGDSKVEVVSDGKATVKGQKVEMN